MATADRKKKAVRIIRALKKLFPHPETALRHRTVWEFLVAVILSAQTTDKKVNEVTARLFRKYRTLGDYARADPNAFQKDVSSVNFYRNKARNILKTAKMVRDTFNGRVPNSMEEILTLPGVARKTANVVLSEGYGVVEGIVVDTHVRRLARLLGLTKHDDPVKIERDLMEVIPKTYWRDFSLALIWYGRLYCPARPHDHAKCPLRKFYK